MKQTSFYDQRLSRYFEEHFGEYSESVAYYGNPAENKWKFYIPELKKVIILTCDDNGVVTEERKVRVVWKG